MGLPLLFACNVPKVWEVGEKAELQRVLWRDEKRNNKGNVESFFFPISCSPFLRIEAATYGAANEVRRWRRGNFLFLSTK